MHDAFLRHSLPRRCRVMDLKCAWHERRHQGGFFSHLNMAKIRSALTEWDLDLLNRSALSFKDAKILIQYIASRLHLPVLALVWMQINEKNVKKVLKTIYNYHFNVKTDLSQ